jgi:putative polyhydroxyalkanoate system protein
MAARLKSDHGIDSQWDEDILHFQRTGLSGTLRLDAKFLAIEVQLGFLLSAFCERISGAIEQSLDELLGSSTNAKKKHKE